MVYGVPADLLIPGHPAWVRLRRRAMPSTARWRRRLSGGTWRDSGEGAFRSPCLTRNPFAGIRRVAGH